MEREYSPPALHFSSSFKDFLSKSDSRISQLLCRYLYRAYQQYEYPCSGNYPYAWMYDDKMFTTSEINYITFRTDGTLSYLPAGKEHLTNANGEWSTTGRQSGRPGKVIRKIFTKRAQKMFKDSDFEIFGNQYKSYYNDGLEFTLEPAEKVGEIYRSKQENGDGSLNSSCMRNSDRRLFQIYENCEKLNLLVLRNKNKEMCGRALIWQLDYINDTGEKEPITLMDRVYTSREFMFEHFFEYAKKQGWWRKEKQSFDRKRDFIKPDGSVLKNGIVRIDTPTTFEYYPYIDTLSFGGPNYLTNEERGTDVHPYSYMNTNGSRDGYYEDRTGQVRDVINGNWIPEADGVIIEEGEYAGSITHVQYTVLVNGRRYIWNSELLVQIENNEHILLSEAGYCELNYSYHRQEDIVFSIYDRSYYHKDECVLSAQGWILRGYAVQHEGVVYHWNEAPEEAFAEQEEAETSL